MAEYIEMDALLGKLKERDLCLCVSEADIKELPASDVAPVVHGRWIRYPDCGVTRCNNCDWSIEECFDSNYCPNCGAKMQGEVNE